jgi:hypothetical protein
LSILPRSFFPLLLLLIASGTTAIRAGEIPSILWSQHDTAKAAWVTADRATVGGQMDWSLFGDLEAAVLRGAIARDKGKECTSIGTLRKEIVGSGVANNLEDLARNSVAVFEGTVVDRSVGFADGTPATLLQVRVEKMIKASPQFAVAGAGAILYVAYPVAELDLKGLKLCKSDDLLLKEIPKAGDRILALPLAGPLNEDRNMVYLNSQEIFVQYAGGDFGVPQRWRKDPRINKASSLNEVESLLKADLPPAAGAPLKEDQ